MPPMAHTLRVPGPYIQEVLLPARWQGGPRDVAHSLLAQRPWMHGGLESRIVLGPHKQEPLQLRETRHPSQSCHNTAT